MTGPTVPDDHQAQRVYDAEREAWSFSRAVGLDPVLRLSDLRRIAADAVSSAWWAYEYVDGGPVRVVGRRDLDDDAHTSVEQRLITFGAHGERTRATLAHELAHIAAPSPRCWHGASFCAAYLDIVLHLLGTDAASRLRAEFRRHHVLYVVRRSAADKEAA